jgi:hypothetical protein
MAIHVSESRAVQRAALRAVAYADIFAYPLDADEVHRYLHGVVATGAATDAALEASIGPDGALSRRDGFYTLRGREDLVDQRRGRAAHAARLWPIAVWYGRLIAKLPFVRMVAVTGSLAWDNVDANGDIDFLVVTEPDRLWVCHWMIAVLTQTVRLGGVPLCPNYILSERALALTDQNLYTAYELAQMKPIAGYDTYRNIREANAWTQSFLPNTPALELPVVDRWHAHAGYGTFLVRAARLVEPVLRSNIGTLLERLEMRYRIRKWTRHDAGVETEYGQDCCKAHTSAHKAKILAAFAERLEHLETT